METIKYTASYRYTEVQYPNLFNIDHQLTNKSSRPIGPSSNIVSHLKITVAKI